MEIITIDSEAYQELKEQITLIATFVCGLQNKTVEDRWIDSNEAILLLGVSERTLQRFRSERIIDYSIIKGRCRYRLSEIERILEEHIVSSSPKTLKELSMKRNSK